MSMNFSGTMQGAFISTGAPYLITLRSGFSWMWVKNLTQIAAAAANQGIEFYFDPIAMANGSGIEYSAITTAATGAMKASIMAANTGFFVYDSSIQSIGAMLPITSIDNSAIPVVSSTNTTGLLANSTMVKIYNTAGALQFAGMDFTVGAVVADTSFQLLYAPQIVAAAGPGSYAIVPYNPIYYPQTRYITAITAQAGTGYAVVTTSIPHGFVVGQKIAFSIPSVTSTAFGMTQLDQQVGTVLSINTAVGTNTFVVNINVSGYSAFAFPLTTAPDFTPALAIPAGIDTAVVYASNVSPTAPAYVDQAQTGVLLMNGVNSPAGQTGDQIIWVAGTSWNIG